MSDWPPGRDGGGAGGAGPRTHHPLPPIQRPPTHQEQENSTTNVSQPKSLRSAVFSKLENLVREMQDTEHGVPVRSQKLFFTDIPAAFMGYDLIEWLMDRLCIEDSPVEAVHLANLLCQFGYYFPVSEQKNLLVKDDSSLYRFQSPYFWPSQHHTPDHIEYAIYLYKRAQKNKKIHGLEPGLPDYENDALVHLKRILANKWDFVVMQAEEQLKVAKDRKKGDKIINESQEKAYWRVYKPPPGYNTLVENPPVPLREQKVRARRNNKEMLKHEIQFMSSYHNVSRVKTSKVAEDLLEYTDTFVEWDPLLLGCGPSNPWMSDDTTYWEINKPIPDNPTEKRVRKWAISLEDIVMDPLGIQELLAYMKKEYSHENLRFWLAVQELKRGPGSETKIKKKVKEIYEEFLCKGAKAEINIDGKTMEETRLAMKNPTRNTYDKAAEHVYLLLLKKDCYPRFIRSDHYKALLTSAINPGSSRKRIFNFPQIRKKPSQTQPPQVEGAPGFVSTVAGREGIDPSDFEIYGMDGGVESGDEKTPLNNSSETSRRILCPSGDAPSGRGNESCPWESPGPGPGHTPSRSPSPGPGISDHKSGSGILFIDNNIKGPANSSTSRTVLLTNIPSSDSMAEVHPGTASTTVTNLGQVELDLDHNTGSEAENGNKSAATTGNGTRKKSSSAIQAEEEEGGSEKKNSKSSDESEGAPSPSDARAQCASGGRGSATVNPDSAGETALTSIQTSDSHSGALSCKDNEGKEGEMGEGENGCGWISSQEVCPWEDDSLTPTWL